MLKKLFWIIRGLVMIAGIVLFFAPFSIKKENAELKHQTVFYFDEQLYRSYLFNLKVLYQQEIQKLEENSNIMPSQMVLTKVHQQIAKTSNTENNKHFTTVKDQKPSLAFQKQLQQFAKQLHQLDAQYFEKNLIVLLNQTEQKINLDENIRFVEKIAFRMIRIDQEVLHQEYLQLVHLDRQYFYPKQKNKWAYERAQKEMGRKMLKSLWHSAIVLNQIQTEKLEENQIATLIEEIKNPYWTEKKSKWMVLDL